MLHKACTMQRHAASGRAISRPSLHTLRPNPSSKPSSFVPRAAPAADVAKKAEEPEVEEYPYAGPEVIPSTQQVSTFLSTLCNETEVAEMHLKMGSFELKVKRSVSGGAAAAAAPAPAPAAAPAPAPAAPAFLPPSFDGPVSVEDTIDESLVYVNSPKVGIFRRGRYAGGKKVGSGNCVNVGDQVKKGQTVGFVEQLGTHVMIESPIAGEVVKVHLDDGAPIEYGQLVLELAPFFGGHIIGDKKYA